MAGVPGSTSDARQRPAPSARGSRCCTTTPRRASASSARRLPLAVVGVRVGEAADRTTGVGASLGDQYQGPALRKRERGLDACEVGQRADRDDIGIVVQCPFEAVRERRRVEADLALADRAEAVGVQHLDRVLEREDVPYHRSVEVIDECRQGGRDAGPGRAGHDHQAVRVIEEGRTAAGMPRSAVRGAPKGTRRMTIETEPRCR